ncbi:MAG: isochorismate synthase [Polyangiaceae bacterium]|nr:isochorismate synthase [Polyangiaceae bacterium]MCW5790371.1 isochorismate synthase [Polyangiaceae bacterium]
MNPGEERQPGSGTSTYTRSGVSVSLPNRAALERALQSSAPLISLQLAAPHTEVEALLSQRGDAPSVLFAPPGGPHWAGLGVAAEITARGEGRFRELVSISSKHPTERVGLSGDGAPLPRFFGGFAFQAMPAPSEAWGEFGDARFVLPRVSYTVTGREAWLTLTLGPAERDPAAVEQELRALFARLCREPAPAESPSVLLTDSVTPSPAVARARWDALVGAILAAIERGEVEKVVAARAESFLSARAVDGVEVLRRLRGEPHINRIALRFGERELIAATPERLVSLAGFEVRTEALAGTRRAADHEAALTLLASEKDRAEHRPVAREIVRCLTPLASAVHAAEQPIVRELRHVVHLLTPITAELKERRHVLSLVEALHPTPAVGGTPTAAALDFIRAHEELERGWYAGPIGWFDAAGDGEFWVGLRSALLERSSVQLFAGAGIVRGSESAREYAETELKLRALGLL